MLLRLRPGARPGMRPRRSSDALKMALREEMGGVIADRLRGILLLGSVPTLLSMGPDLASGDPDLRAQAFTKGVGSLLYFLAGIIVGWTRPWPWSSGKWVRLGCASLLCLVPSACGLATHNVMLAAYVLTVVVLGLAMIIPWGAGPQLWIVVLCLLGFGVNLWAARATVVDLNLGAAVL